MYIPGIVISLLTFPGVIVHELAHQICCRLCRIPVYEVKYFRLKNPCGYVIHESTDNPWKNLMTGMGPFFINTILGMIISCPGYFYLWGAGEYMHNSGGLKGMYLLLYWLGLSILMHAFPSTGDAKSMMESILKNKDVNIFWLRAYYILGDDRRNASIFTKLLQAAEDFNIDLSQSWMIGDSENDVLAGKNAKCRTTLIGDGDSGQNITSNSLLNAIMSILK